MGQNNVGEESKRGGLDSRGRATDLVAGIEHPLRHFVEKRKKLMLVDSVFNIIELLLNFRVMDLLT